MMKHATWMFLTLMAVCTGCETLQTPRKQRGEAARRQAAQRRTEEQIRSMKGRVESVETEQTRLTGEIQQLRQKARAGDEHIAQIDSRIGALETEQARKMSELIKRMEELFKKNVPARSASTGERRGPGREHIVESGHTLSAIAQAYGCTVRSIKQANGLKSDRIYAEQKLFIPE